MMSEPTKGRNWWAPFRRASAGVAALVLAVAPFVGFYGLTICHDALATVAIKPLLFKGDLFSGAVQSRIDAGAQGGQAGVADLFGEAKPPKGLHGAGSDVVAFRIGGRCGRARLHHRDVDPAPRQIDRERQPDRPRPDDQHFGLGHFNHQPRLVRRASR